MGQGSRAGGYVPALLLLRAENTVPNCTGTNFMPTTKVPLFFSARLAIHSLAPKDPTLLHMSPRHFALCNGGSAPGRVSTTDGYVQYDAEPVGALAGAAGDEGKKRNSPAQYVALLCHDADHPPAAHPIPSSYDTVQNTDTLAAAPARLQPVSSPRPGSVLVNCHSEPLTDQRPQRD